VTIKAITDDDQRIQFLVCKCIVFSSEWKAQYSPQKMGLETRKEVLEGAIKVVFIMTQTS
jgi:hypothetical protein